MDLKNLMRASAPKFKIEQAKTLARAATKAPSLGPLAELPGKWVGKGFNLVSLPDFNGGQKFRLMLNATMETIEFKDIGAPVPNRGNVQPDIEYLGLHYLQEVNDAVTNGALHLETGMWLNLPPDKTLKSAFGTKQFPPQPVTVARLSTIPHGDSLLAQGDFFTIPGPPVIEVEDSTPFTLGPNGERVNDPNKETYLLPYSNMPLPPGVPAGSTLNPNLVLVENLKQLEANGQKIINTVVFRVSATPVLGIQTIELPPPVNTGGIVNIPFVVKNADANSMAAIFWIETVQNPDGSRFMQLQYTQTVILDFPVLGPDGRTKVDIKWPHVSVATLVKR